MNADTIAKAMLQMRKDAREKAGFINKNLLSPSDDVVTAIKSVGGLIGSEEWEQWCRSGDTCACNSHDPGQSSTMVSIPESWMLKEFSVAKLSHVFKTKVDEDKRAIMIVPADPVVLVVEHNDSRWAGYTFAANLRCDFQYSIPNNMTDAEYIQSLLAS